jgi:HEAT repeat protein
MRTSLGLLILTTCVAGCGGNAPMTAHGKPVDYWVEKIGDPDVKVRLTAVKALGNVGVKDPVVVPTLTRAVKDKHVDVRVEAILALLRIGPPASDSIPVLTEACKDADPKVRQSAAKALQRIQGS